MKNKGNHYNKLRQFLAVHRNQKLSKSIVLLNKNGLAEEVRFYR